MVTLDFENELNWQELIGVPRFCWTPARDLTSGCILRKILDLETCPPLISKNVLAGVKHIALYPLFQPFLKRMTLKF